jgi:hypothetical protein
MSNLDIWSKVSRPPKEALKTIQAGRLKGMTDVNPQWRIKVMTEVFGPCGDGWYYEIIQFWTEPGANGELMAFAHIHLFTKQKLDAVTTGWSQPISGIGGSALVAKEKDGLRANDEAYKMAVTDALSVAMKQLGVAADIYAGLWDGSKYKDAPKVIEGKGTITPTHGALDNVTPERLEQLKEIAATIVDFATKDALDDAYITFDEVSDSEERIAVWALLQPNSAIRSKLKAMAEEKKPQPKAA